jgi:hypothetical protein
LLPAKLRRWRHSPTHHDQLALAVNGSHHRSRIVGKHIGQGREVTGTVPRVTLNRSRIAA